MSETYNHGITIVEVDDGVEAIQTVSSSVVAFAGTAPDAEGGLSASLTTGSGKSALVFTAKAENATGNNLSVTFIHGGESSDLSVALVGKNIQVTLATDGSGKITSTANSVKAALEANGDISGLVGVSSGGTGIVSAMSEKYLSGGVDEAFPLNTPVMVTPSDGKLARLGLRGTLYRAVSNAWTQYNCVSIIVRVAQVNSDSDPATISNVMGDLVARSGVYAFLTSKSVTGLHPRIIVAPGFSSDASVKSALYAVTKKLDGFCFIDAPLGSTPAEALDYAGDVDSRYGMVCKPYILVARQEGNKLEPQSSLWAGAMSGNDNKRGFWVSPSNTPVEGIIGLEHPVDYVFGDSTCLANVLNAGNVSTIIRENGFRLWGNRTTSSDSKWQFVNVVRTAQILNASIAENHQSAIDKGLTTTYYTAVAEGVNAYMRTLIAKGALVGTQNVGNKVNCCIPNSELNTAANITQGKAYFDVYFTATYPAEQIVFRSILNTNGLAEISEL